MAITDSKLKALQGKKHDNSKPLKMADREGLSVYHYKSGKLSFVFRYRYANKAQELTLGNYSSDGKKGLTLLQARKQAAQCKKFLADGLNPKVERQLEREKKLKAVTVKGALEYWLDNYAAKKRANHEKHRSQFQKHVYPFIGHLPLDKCETRHWVQVFDDITSGKHHRAAPVASGYILQNAKQALRFCRNRQFAHSMALEGLNITDIGEHQQKKDRILSWSELMDVWHWAYNIKNNWYYRNLVLLLVVFGCRTQELRLSKVAEWDFEEMIWTVPKEHSKTGNEIKRPIPEQMKAYIQSVITQADSNYLLGSLKRPEAVSGFGGKLWEKLGHKEVWTLHDLRRTFATLLNDMQIEPYVVEQLLGHSLGGVMKIYNRSQHIEKKKIALDLWVTKLNDIAIGSNVRMIRA
ncbi:tyrosine-type recombinase/integrase [Vibrio alginolyticus]|uniref:tyrosine-type recombinase/integrase n=1 Tax=Vibrio alginolyticus TaxID=663 RepID=UPI00215B7882|nr:site-specific integrase [Vibrio alginolyticus]MCR9643510.1 tyrosine-type recombinase/integrase [Vibrio alginolyticus]